MGEREKERERWGRREVECERERECVREIQKEKSQKMNMKKRKIIFE